MVKIRRSKSIITQDFKKSIPFFKFKVKNNRVYLDKDIDKNLNSLSCQSKASLLRKVSSKLDEVRISSFSGYSKFSSLEDIKKLSNLQQNRIEALRKYAIKLSNKVNDCRPSYPKI